MPNYNYAPVVTKVQRAIDKYGRFVTFRARAGATPDNDPLAGPQDADVISNPVKGVFVPITGLAQLGISTTKTDAFKHSEQVGLFPPSAIDYAAQAFLVDGGGTWKVDAIDMLKPGDTALLYYIGVSRP